MDYNAFVQQWGRQDAAIKERIGISLQETKLSEKLLVRETVILFLHDKSIRGAAGLQIDAGMQLMIAVQACILILNLDIDYFRGWVDMAISRLINTVVMPTSSGASFSHRSANFSTSLEYWIGKCTGEVSLILFTPRSTSTPRSSPMSAWS